MAKWYGSVGYAEMLETRPGVYQEEITERNYYGDMTRNARNLRAADGVNDNVEISNQFSIVADHFARQNFHQMRYITYMGTKWKVSNVGVQYPRLILTAGGVYNG